MNNIKFESEHGLALVQPKGYAMKVGEFKVLRDLLFHEVKIPPMPEHIYTDVGELLHTNLGTPLLMQQSFFRRNYLAFKISTRQQRMLFLK